VQRRRQAAVSEAILSHIPGHYIAEVLKTLPNPATAKTDEMIAIVNLPGIGRVCIRAKRIGQERGGSTDYYWQAESTIIAQ
jgi:hypothetical protein